MTINDQIRDEKLQYDINREAAKISALSSGKIRKYEYLTGEDILPSNQQQIMVQAKFTYSPLGKAFEKQIETIEDQGQKQVDASKDLIPKEQIKPTEDRSNHKSKAAIIFNELINKRKKIMSELYDSFNYNSLKFEYVGPTKDVSFYDYMDSKDLFNAIKTFQIKFSETKNKQNEFLNKLNNIKICKEIEEVNNFFTDYAKILSDANYDSKHSETKGKGLKILTPKQMLQRLPIALVQVKAGNNLENL